MVTGTLERELLDLEQQYWRAIKDRDVEAALRLTDDPCIVAGAQGVAAVDRPTFERMLTAGAWTLEEFEIKDDARVRRIGDDVAIVAYTVREALTVEGQPVKLEAADVSLWVRRGGRWACALHTESLAGDPFGRDRQPTSPAR
jgi:ketosteroid isomerase-like protein